MQVVSDVHGREYRLESEPVAGGESVLAQTEHPHALVRLRPPEAEPLDELLRADLEGLSVCRPEALLQPPHHGYVMYLERDAEPLDHLYRPSRLTAAAVGRWYAETGGARRRLRALASLATTVAALHGRGLCIADLSPHTVLVPLDHADADVQLIAPEALHAPGDREVRRFTKPYVAPEVLRGDVPCSMRSDVYALARLVVETLAPQDAGEALDRLAERALMDPAGRPAAAIWARALHREADSSYRCPCSCWNFAHWTDCLSCGRANRAGATLRIADTGETLPIADGGARLLRRHFATGCATPDGTVAELALSLRPAGLRIERIGEHRCTLLPADELLPGIPVTVAPGAIAELDLGDRRAELLWP